VHQENYFNGVIHTLPDSEDPEVLLGVLLRKYPNPPLFAPFWSMIPFIPVLEPSVCVNCPVKSPAVLCTEKLREESVDLLLKRSDPEKLPASVREEVSLPSSRIICALTVNPAERPGKVNTPVLAGTYRLPKVEISKPLSHPAL
jgi:hypothetical protein